MLAVEGGDARYLIGENEEKTMVLQIQIQMQIQIQVQKQIQVQIQIQMQIQIQIQIQGLVCNKRVEEVQVQGSGTSILLPSAPRGQKRCFLPCFLAQLLRHQHKTGQNCPFLTLELLFTHAQ